MNETPTVVVLPDQVDCYHQQGYLVPDTITTANEVESLCGIDHYPANHEQWCDGCPND